MFDERVLFQNYLFNKYLPIKNPRKDRICAESIKKFANEGNIGKWSGCYVLSVNLKDKMTDTERRLFRGAESLDVQYYKDTDVKMLSPINQNVTIIITTHRITK